MSRRRSDESFVAFAETQRERLVGAAVLLGATGEQAHDLVAWALATSYPRWERAQRPDLEVVRLVLTSDADVIDVPWRDRSRVQLVDAVAPTLAAIPAALQRLPRQQRAVLVGRDHLGLADAPLSTVTGVEVAQLPLLLREARRVFGVHDVGARLAAAVAPAADPAGAVAAQDDLRHGRWVQRRRRSRALALTVVALLVIGLLVVQFRPKPAPVSIPTPDLTPATSPTPTPTPACDTSRKRCQVEASRAWRAQVATVVATALDPDGTYFSGDYTYGDDRRYDGYWSGPDGALGLDIISADDGATEVFVQVATSRSAAVRCGAITRHRCVRQQFMDGNWFTLSPSVDVQHGIEVQYRPDGDEVITVVARNTGGGPPLEIGRGDLLTLVQDPRLRLPPR